MDPCQFAFTAFVGYIPRHTTFPRARIHAKSYCTHVRHVIRPTLVRKTSFIPKPYRFAHSSLNYFYTAWHQYELSSSETKQSYTLSPKCNLNAPEDGDKIPPTTGKSISHGRNDTDPQGTELSKHNSNDAESKSNAIKGILAWTLSALKRFFMPGGFIWGFATGISLSVVVLFFQWSGTGGENLLREKVTLFDFILQDISSSYVEKVDINRLFETGINSMLGSLDPYTQFENNAQAAEMSVKTNGRYAGVGLGITMDDSFKSKSIEKNVIVVSAFEGYAFDAGVRPGDVIETVSGEPIKGLSLEKVTDLLRGEPGTTVMLTVLREGETEPLSFSLPRKSVRIKDVPAFALVGNSEDRIGYIRLQSFAKDAASEVKLAIQTLVGTTETSSPKLTGLVLDLRGNPGGLLTAAIEVAELFVPRDSVIVSTKGRGLAPNPTYVSSQEPVIPQNLPLAVLVNGQTASASEIVAGAIQDLDYGVIVGSRTFGKGLVQNVQDLPFNTALKYTVGKYYTPSGRCIQALNYEQANRDGQFQVKKIEDVDRKQFQTRIGRTVRDGGGIEPEIEVIRRPSFLEQALFRQNMYFRFATRFGASLKMNELPKTFAVTDELYHNFVDFVSSTEFKYESRFDEAFEQLNTMFNELGYQDARSKVYDLKTATEIEMKTDFVRHEGEIRAQMESAIRFRFQPDSERIIAELKNDNQLEEALRILKNKQEYQRLLSAPAGDSQKEFQTVADKQGLVT